MKVNLKRILVAVLSVATFSTASSSSFMSIKPSVGANVYNPSNGVAKTTLENKNDINVYDNKGLGYLPASLTVDFLFGVIDYIDLGFGFGVVYNGVLSEDLSTVITKDGIAGTATTGKTFPSDWSVNEKLFGFWNVPLYVTLQPNYDLGFMGMHMIGKGGYNLFSFGKGENTKLGTATISGGWYFAAGLGFDFNIGLGNIGLDFIYSSLRSSANIAEVKTGNEVTTAAESYTRYTDGFGVNLSWNIPVL